MATLEEIVTDKVKEALGEALKDRLKKSATSKEENFSKLQTSVLSPISLATLWDGHDTTPVEQTESRFGFETTIGAKRFQPGLTLVLGGTFSGKTTFLEKHIIDFQAGVTSQPDQEPVGPTIIERLIVDEPLEDVARLRVDPHYTYINTTFNLLARIMNHTKNQPDSLLVIDSLSDHFKVVEGNTGKEGITHDAFRALASLSNLLKSLDVKVVASLNPGYLTEVAYDGVHDALVAKVGTVLKFAKQETRTAFVRSPIRYDTRDYLGKRFSEDFRLLATPSTNFDGEVLAQPGSAIEHNITIEAAPMKRNPTLAIPSLSKL